MGGGIEAYMYLENMRFQTHGGAAKTKPHIDRLLQPTPTLYFILTVDLGVHCEPSSVPQLKKLNHS